MSSPVGRASTTSLNQMPPPKETRSRGRLGNREVCRKLTFASPEGIKKPTGSALDQIDLPIRVKAIIQKQLQASGSLQKPPASKTQIDKGSQHIGKS